MCLVLDGAYAKFDEDETVTIDLDDDFVSIHISDYGQDSKAFQGCDCMQDVISWFESRGWEVTDTEPPD